MYVYSLIICFLFCLYVNDTYKILANIVRLSFDISPLWGIFFSLSIDKSLLRDDLLLAWDDLSVLPLPQLIVIELKIVVTLIG